METALVTGMLETSFLPNKQVGLDVKEDSIGSFSKIFESSLKTNDVAKSNSKDCKIEEDVRSKMENVEIEPEENEPEKAEDVNDIIEEVLDDIKENEVKPKKKDKKIKEEGCINDFAQQNDLIKEELLSEQDVINQGEDIKIEDTVLKQEDVVELVGSIRNGEQLELTPEDKLDDLLSKLNVELREDVKLKDESEQVIEVGPQSVETEKIKLNIKDVENVKMQDSNESEEISQFLVSDETDSFVQESDNVEVKDVDNFGNNSFKEEVEQLGSELIKEGVSKEEINKEDVSKLELSKTKDVEKEINKDVENKNFVGQNLTSQDSTEEKGFEEKDKGFSKTKDDKVKIKDFRSKDDVEGIQKFIKEEELKLDSSLKTRDVDSIRQFENIDVDQMDILDQVTEKLEVSLFDNKSEMVIKLKPNDLGNVTVKITIENGVMNAKFLAESVKVKETLESNLNNLKESLKEQGLNVQDLNVSVDSGRSQNHNFSQNNLIYLNDKKSYQSNRSVSYGDYGYETADSERKVSSYWMNSTVSFLA